MPDPYDALIPAVNPTQRGVERIGRGVASVVTDPVMEAVAALRGRLNDKELQDMLFNASLGVVPGAGLAGKAARAGGKAASAAERAIVDPKLRAKAEKVTGAFPQYAESYPAAGPPALMEKLAGGKAGKELTGLSDKQAQALIDADKAFYSKKLTPEAEQFQKARDVIRKDMEVNPWDPYFPPEKRFDVDPKNYPTPYDMGVAAQPVKPETQARWKARYDTPEARARLEAGYERGKQVPNAEDWYKMGQLEQEYIRVLGPEEGRKRFASEFAGSMAATTGGADPTSNMLMGHYADVMRTAGTPIPEASHQLPFPIGGRYAAGNLAQYGKFRERPELAFDPANPKRHDFQQAFLGNKRAATMDEQMTGAIEPGTMQPEWYGPATNVVRELADARGVDPRAYQDVTWAGLKAQKMDKAGKPFEYEGPMIQHHNMAIERTHRLTGMPREEIVRRGLVLKEIPLYGAGGVVAGGAVAPWDALSPQ